VFHQERCSVPPSIATACAAPLPSLYLREEPDGGAGGLLAGLSETEIERLFSVSTLRSFPAREIVFRQGDVHDGVFIILSGQMRIFYTGRSGREITLAYWSPGNFVGGPEIFDRGLHIWSGQADQRTQVLHVPGGALRQLAKQMPRLAIALIDALVQKGKCFSGLIQMLGACSAAERLAELLALMADRDGRESPEGVIVGRKQTQDDLAKMVGATRQWVSATLKRFREDGLVAITPSHIVIRDVERLRRLGV